MLWRAVPKERGIVFGMTPCGIRACSLELQLVMLSGYIRMNQKSGTTQQDHECKLLVKDEVEKRHTRIRKLLKSCQGSHKLKASWNRTDDSW